VGSLRAIKVHRSECIKGENSQRGCERETEATGCHESGRSCGLRWVADDVVDGQAKEERRDKMRDAQQTWAHQRFQ
jgi:hypothetical protein